MCLDIAVSWAQRAGNNSLSSHSKTHSVSQQEQNPRRCLPDLRCWRLNWSILSLQGFCCKQRKWINALLICSWDSFAHVWMNLHKNTKINTLVSHCCSSYSMLLTHQQDTALFLKRFLLIPQLYLIGFPWKYGMTVITAQASVFSQHYLFISTADLIQIT